MNEQQRWQDQVNMILGAWLIFAPFLGIGGVNDVAAWNSYLSGAVVAILAIAALSRPQMWEEWINLLVGIWLIIAPFVLGFATQAGPTWNQVILGVLIGGDAAWAMLQKTGGRHKVA